MEELVNSKLDFTKSAFKMDKTESELLVTSALIRFGTPDECDCYGEYFTKDTDFSLVLPAKISMYVDHGYNTLFGVEKVGIADLYFGSDDISEGIFMRSSLDLSKSSTSLLADKIENKELGTSSGAVYHLIRYKMELDSKGNYTWWVANWPLGEGSYTTVPADTRNLVVPSKADFDKLAGKTVSYAQKMELMGSLEKSPKENKPSKNQGIDPVDFSKGNDYIRDLNRLLNK